MKLVLKTLRLSGSKLYIGMLGILLIFGASTAYAQSAEGGNCPSCKYEQAKYDSIKLIHEHATKELSDALKALTLAKQQLEDAKKEQNAKDVLAKRETTVNQANAKVENARAIFDPLSKKLETLKKAVEKCFDSESPAICKKCQDGKEINDNNAFCDDGDPCTKNDRCVNGVCIGDPVTSSENPNCGGN